MNARKSEPRNSSTLLAFVGVVLVVGGMIAFVALLVPFFAIVATGFSLLVLLQYLVWGWWFPKIQRRDDEEE